MDSSEQPPGGVRSPTTTDETEDGGDRSRRVVLGTMGAAIAALAGCFGTSEGEYYDGEDLVDESDAPTYDGYLADVSYPGTVDWTGRSEVRVAVGTGREGMGYGPRSIRIETGTTVVWEWIDDGGRHDVVATDGEFASEETAETGHTFAHTFADPGTYTYYCTPHEHRGMKGGLEVV